MDCNLWMLGYQVQFIKDELPEQMRSFNSIEGVIEALATV
jgi:hypothetical protein